MPPAPTERPLAPGQRLPESDRKALSPAAVAELQALSTKYPDPLAATLPALYVAQREFGFLSLVAMKEVARVLKVPEGHVFGVATFYTMFRKAPVGKYHLQVCTNLSCSLRGAAAVVRQLLERTGAPLGTGTSADGLFSVEEVECLGSCGSGPCLQVNQAVYDEFLDSATIDALLESCRNGQVAPWGDDEP